MRVTCPHCQTKARVTSRKEMTKSTVHLYCQCTDTEKCGATFVSLLSLSHTLNPPRQTTAEIAAAVLRTLPHAERMKLLSGEDR